MTEGSGLELMYGRIQELHFPQVPACMDYMDQKFGSGTWGSGVICNDAVGCLHTRKVQCTSLQANIGFLKAGT